MQDPTLLLAPPGLVSRAGLLLTGAGGTRPCLGSPGAGPSPARVVVLPEQGRAGCFAVGSVSPFPGQLPLGSKQWDCPSPVMSDGLKQGLCSNPPEAAQKLPALPPPGVHPAPASPPAPKGYCPSISGLHPARPQRCSRSRCPQPRAEACPAWLLLGQDMLAPCLSPPQP